ncbi:hypothetical protein [Aquimarina sp. 2201CG5-10]|uniref:hypothetical protein n=1 Tax=Aquimarina callyspongiae TaxID=3098150 RepID=UPI002AB469B1|nr:hypothetical protein [Aquimarina sp. 2201CG5-10]MDY8135420.1 hypothetical protein [Aquimarina sp. 2201CG5-10]
MNRILIISFALLIGLISCKKSEKTSNKLEIAEKYFVALDKSNSSEIKDLLADSLVTMIPKYEYEVRYSKNDYVEKWLKWDSVFEPTYKVIEMRLENGIVKAKVSKTDKRIHFLMQKPFLTNEILRFENDKIISVETEYLNFDEVTWEKNKNGLLSWTEENHPELNLNRFIYDQTESGGMKFLKAIELYKNKK